MTTHHSHRRTIAAIGVTAALTLSACGGDDDDGAADTAPAAQDAPAEPAATEPADTAPADTAPTDTAPTDTAPADTGADESEGAAAAITIADFAFSGVTEVAVGTTVVVTNTDGSPHTWTAVDGSFDSGSLGQDDTFEFTFTEPGEFSYVCNFHPSMTGTIVVTG